MALIILITFLLPPFVLTIWNLITFISYIIKKKEKDFVKIIELIAMVIGFVYLFFYLSLIEVKFVDWNIQLSNAEKHSIIARDHLLTIIIIFVLSLLGYLIIRFITADKQSPIISLISISSIYLGIVVCILWSVQTKDFFLMLLPVNIILIFIKSIYIMVYNKNTLLQAKVMTTKYKKLSNILNTATNLPWLALIFSIPLLGIIVTFLSLFGQEPDSLIKAWSETADWTMSKKIAPQNIHYDEHYLCTVAAGGHTNIVKPLRNGLRHGNPVMVNRQLCIANAFEQILEEKTPLFHKQVRTVYDTFGYPISKHIKSKYVADLIYYLMKPLEWFFLLVIYAVDVKPENRIAVQYPHKPIPE